MDESNATCGKRLASIGLENTEANRQAYRTLLVTVPGLGDYVSGAILFEETLYQSTTDGKKMVDVLVEQKIVPGIKVDKVILRHMSPNIKFSRIQNFFLLKLYSCFILVIELTKFDSIGKRVYILLFIERNFSNIQFEK